jgi:hypothetical protein
VTKKGDFEIGIHADTKINNFITMLSVYPVYVILGAIMQPLHIDRVKLLYDQKT